MKVDSNLGIFTENRLQVYIFLLNFTEIAIIITINLKMAKNIIFKEEKMKKNLKKLMALLAVFVMVVGLVTIPNASAQADETAASGTYDCANTWWNGATNIVGYMADDSTIGDMETSKGQHPGENGFMWWTAVVLDLQEDGNYVVTEIIAPGASTKLDVVLTTGRIVIDYHSDAADQDSVAFWNSLVVGDTLSVSGKFGYIEAPTWDDLVAVGEVGVFTKVVEEEPAETEASGTYDCANTWWNGATNIVGYMADDSTIGDMETSKGQHPGENGFMWWTAVVLDLQEDGNYVVTEIIAPGASTKLDVVLTTGRIVIDYHSDAADQDSVAFWNSLVVGDTLSVSGKFGYIEAPTWDDLVAVGEVGVFTKVAADEGETPGTGDEEETPGTGDEEETPDEPELPAIEVLATATFANGYDWTNQVNQIYIFASEDETATVSGFTGQDAGTFGWFHTVILEANGDGTYTVVSSDFATNNGAESVALSEGKVILMAHSTTSYVDSFNALTALAAGDVVALDTAWADIAAAYGDVEVSVGTIVEEETPGTGDEEETPGTGDEEENTPSADDTTTNTEAPKTGDSMPVAAMASMLLVAMACVALGLKKRNA